jgi:hypothetical protein
MKKQPISFFQVCEWIRAGLDVRIKKDNDVKKLSIPADMRKYYELIERFSISTGREFVVVG